MMRRMLLLTLCLFGLFSVQAAIKTAQSYRNITMNDGLSANAVRNIAQDVNGYMWFGTDNGLCRYDGRKMVHFRIAELGNNQYISAMLACDNGIYAGTEQGVFFIDFERQNYKKLPIDIHSIVTHISVDKDGGIWISTRQQGLWHYVTHTGQIKHYDLKDTNNEVSQVMIDNSNQIWTVTFGSMPIVHKLNRLHEQFEPVKLSSDVMYHALCMLQTKDGRMWLGTWENGLMLMHSDGRLEQVLSPKKSKVGWHIHTLYELPNGDISIGCDDGVVSFNPKTGEWDKYDDRFVYAITCDTEGGLWFGTFYGGVKYISPVGRRFDGYTLADGLTGNVISHFCEDRKGRIWIGSDDGGLICYSPEVEGDDRRSAQFVDYPHQNLLSKRNVHALCLDNNDDLWIGTYSDGVIVMNLETGRLRQYTQTNDPNSLDNASAYTIHLDSFGQIWVATMGGLNLYDRQNDAFIRIGEINAITIDIDEDKAGNLWLSTQGEGLWQYNRKTKKLKRVVAADKGDGSSLPDDDVNCCLIDQTGKIWVGTFAGLCRYDEKKECFERVRLDVPSQNIMSIIEDNGALWITTERGIVKYVPEVGVQRFTLQDGLVGEQFQPNSCLKASDGRIYFGSTCGFNTFYPYQIKANSVMPPVYVTSLQILNHDEYNAEGMPMNFTLTKEISIGYTDSKMISLSFAALSYCSPEKIQYAYMLEGFDHDWNYIGNENRATYTNLPAGTYTFRVKATNNDGVWSTNEAKLKIIVKPPFWWSWYAKTFYLLLLGAAIFYYVHFRLKREEMRHQRELQHLNEQKEKEVREARLNFFTMIAHEIRTPVSLIIGPLEKLKGVTSNPQLDIIERNAHRLLELVNQLLDFRKVEQQSLNIRFAPQNIYELIKSVSERFAPTFEHNGKQFTVEYPDKHFTAIIDKEAVTKVVSNLLTNANKYTKDDVRLSCIVEPDGERFRICVCDNGVGIREEDRHRIFQPFFQAEGNKPGTGIGLNIVKNIVDLHHGEINVDSELGKGSTFTVILPVMQEVTEDTEKIIKEEKEHFSDNDVTIERTSSDSTNLPLSPSDSTHPTMLIVDDSEDMVRFLSENFKEKYHVITAGDGIEALDTLKKHEVNIIISDWMMPRMDGAELCRRVRQNLLTSHIPFVMLTAKTDDDSKVTGMDVGADTYIEKPFSLQYLEACIRNILQIRRQLMERFSSQPLEPVTEIAQNSTDNEFLIRMNKIIEENFSNSELNVDFLASRLNISRSGLFAKIKTLADVTPNEMIQIVRLKRAAQLLHEGGHMVSEVGYMVGFSNPSYFSKCFQKQFGIRPGDYMKR